MSKKTLISLLAIVVLLLGIGSYFTPHLAVHNMKKAAEEKDADALSGYVDYPSLRESFKANFNAAMAKKAVNTKDNNPFAALLGTALAAALINPMIDALITPESLAMLMKGNKPEPKQAKPDRSEGNSDQVSSSNDIDTDTSMSYKGFSRFIVRIKKKDSIEEPVEFIFKRDGVISWKLSALRLPLN